MSRIKKKNNTKFNSIDFLNFAVRNYISARILYLNNRLYDAGVMSHEAIEKVMKSILYFKDSELNFNDVHDLNTLKAILVKDFEYQNLIESKSVLMFYQNCYSFRYPDKKTPKSFAAATFDFKLLDQIFFYFHEACFNEIKDEEIKFRNGIYIECLLYFKKNDPYYIEKITKENERFTLEYIEKGKDFWYSNGYYKKDVNGIYKDVYGTLYKE